MIRFAFVFILLLTKCFAQDSVTIQHYIDQYRGVAIAEMQRTGVPAAITIAQGIHESAAGSSLLVQQSNNHFGIKCKAGWLGSSVLHDDDAKGECFRAYTCPADSYKDHSDFLKANKRYAFLFENDPLDYEAWAKGLKQAGYATNPRYPQILITTIERFHLNDLSLLALDKTNELGNDIAFNTNGLVAPAVFKTGSAIFSMDTLPPATTAIPVRQIANANFDITSTYPTGVFSINNCKVVFAERGTSLLAVAMQHRINLKNLLSWNDMEPADLVPVSQLLFIEKKSKKGTAAYHVVLPGETIWQISQEEGIRLDNLMEYNKLSAGNQIPLVGSKLALH